MVPDTRITNMQRRWRAIKIDVFGTRGEVKAADFVRDDSPIPSISETLDRRTLAQGTLALMLTSLELRPLGCFVDKARVPELFVVKDEAGKVKLNKRGDHQLDKEWLFEAVAIRFGLFLEQQGAHGRMICDEPGQGREQDWHARFVALKRGGPVASRVSRIESLAFRRSHQEPGIELADVTVGIMRYAQERSEFIVGALVEALRRAQSQGLGVIHVEA